MKNSFRCGKRSSGIQAIMKVVTNGGTWDRSATWDCVSRRIFHDLSQVPVLWERFASQNWGNFALKCACWITPSRGWGATDYIKAWFTRLMQPFDWSISRDSHVLLKDKNLYDQLTPVARFRSSESLCAFFLQKSTLGLHNSYQISYFWSNFYKSQNFGRKELTYTDSTYDTDNLDNTDNLYN